VRDAAEVLEEVAGSGPSGGSGSSGETASISPGTGCSAWGTNVGRGSIVGAKSLVKGEVPPYSVVAGNPARVVRRRGS
jgi:serine acetyltransferase